LGKTDPGNDDDVTELRANPVSAIRETLSRPERLLPLACLLGAGLLFASELMTMFEFTPPGGEPLDSQTAGDRHGNAMFVVAAFAIGALVVAVLAGSKPAALAVAVMGGIALLVFLLTDLPDAGQVGTLDDPRQSFFDAEAVPQAGFWLELVGALALAISGAALATLEPDQLAALRPGADRSDDDPDVVAPPAPTPIATGNPGHGTAESSNPSSDQPRAQIRGR
jgi:hypothetical protein